MELIVVNIKRLLANTEAGNKKVRLLGISVSNFLGAQKENDGWVQLPLPFGFKG
jgi:DNA polymerase IV